MPLTDKQKRHMHEFLIDTCGPKLAETPIECVLDNWDALVAEGAEAESESEKKTLRREKQHLRDQKQANRDANTAIDARIAEIDAAIAAL